MSLLMSVNPDEMNGAIFVVFALMLIATYITKFGFREFWRNLF